MLQNQTVKINTKEKTKSEFLITHFLDMTDADITLQRLFKKKKPAHICDYNAMVPHSSVQLK